MHKVQKHIITNTEITKQDYDVLKLPINLVISLYILIHAAVMYSVEPPDHAYGENETLPANIRFLGYRDRFHVACLYEVLYNIEPATT